MGPKITAIGNRKGGVGKTSYTLGIATGLKLLGKRVCVLDLDPQANATAALEASGELNIFDVLYQGEPGSLGQAITSTSWAGIDCIPSVEALGRIESESLMTAELRLKMAAEGSEELDQYDHIVIDLPPALGRLTLNGLIWADEVLAITTPEAFSVQGVGEFMKSVRTVQAHPALNPGLRFGGIVVNKVSSAPVTAEHKFQIEQLEEAYAGDMRPPYLPARTAMQDSVSSNRVLTQLPGEGARILTELFVEHARILDGER